MAKRSRPRSAMASRWASWRIVFGTLDQARRELAGYIDDYHHRSQSGLKYQTPAEVAATWEDGQNQVTTRPEATTPTGSRPIRLVDT